MLDVEVDLVRDLGALCGLDALRAEERRDGDEEEAQRETAEYHFVGVGRSEAQSRQRSTEEVATCLMATHPIPNAEVVVFRVFTCFVPKLGRKTGH